MKTKKILRGCGFVQFEDTLHDGYGVRIARKFLTQLIQEVCRLAVRYYEADGEDHFLRFGERMMYSQFAVAVNKLTVLHCSEQSLSRNLRGESRGGRADIWAWYGDSRKTNILLELKRHTFSLTKGIHNRQLKNGLELLIGQTDSLRQQARNWKDNATLIGLDVVLPYCERNSETRLDELIGKDINDRVKHGEEFMQGVMANYKKVNFVGAWFPPSHMTKFDQENRWQYNPYVGFAARIISLPTIRQMKTKNGPS